MDDRIIRQRIQKKQLIDAHVQQQRDLFFGGALHHVCPLIAHIALMLQRTIDDAHRQRTILFTELVQMFLYIQIAVSVFLKDRNKRPQTPFTHDHKTISPIYGHKTASSPARSACRLPYH